MIPELKPGDVLIYEIEGYGVFKPFVRWLLGSKWAHIGVFFDYTKRGLPLAIESVGRGVMIRSPLSYTGRNVRIMRYKGEETVGLKVAKAAERIADNQTSWYGYFDIPRYVLPRLVWFRLTGRRFGFGYRNNNFFICSELVAQAFRDGGYPLFGENYIPLPGDFIKCKLLEKVWEGKI